MARISFGSEFRSRAAFIIGISIANPVILAFYVLLYHEGKGGAELWAVGTSITLALCIFAALFLWFRVYSDRKNRFRREEEAAKWRKIMPTEPADGGLAA
jgi:hypothetical protein